MLARGRERLEMSLHSWEGEEAGSNQVVIHGFNLFISHFSRTDKYASILCSISKVIKTTCG